MKKLTKTPPTLLTTALALFAFSIACSVRAQEAAAEEPSKSLWETSASLGLTLTKGNSDTVLFTANVQSARKHQEHELFLGADTTYGESDDVKNNETLHGYGQYNRLFTERFYGYLRLDALHDGIANVEYRFTLSPGAGYYFIKNPRTQLSGEVGPGFVYEKQGGESRGYLTLRLAENFEHKLNDRARIWQKVELLPQVDDFSNFIINAEIGVESALTKRTSLQVYVQDTYDNEPAPGRERNDVKLVSAVKWKF